jgi:hypothetical protein
MAAQRQVQNAADAAAMAAAMAKLSGQGDPQTVATTFVKDPQYNGLSNATLTVNPPTSGPHAGSNNYYEVVVTYPVTTLFMPVLGANPNQSVQARAVAGYETVPAGELVAALDPTASSGPGLSVTGGASLVVNGRIIVNSPASPAATVDSGGQITAAVSNIVGPTVSGTFNGQQLNQPPMGDPLINLPTPATAASMANHTATPLSGWSTTNWGSVQVSNDKTLDPGVYSSIQITGGNVTFNPGVYILTGGMDIHDSTGVLGNLTVTGNGVMFYNTGTNYDPSTGSPDNTDASLYDPNPYGINTPTSVFGGIDIDGTTATITLSPIASAADPFNGVLIYQSRANTQTIKIIMGGNLSLTGTLYAKWAQFNISGGGTYQAQFIGGSMGLSGQPGDTLTLNYGSTLSTFGRANEVFLVE